MTQLPNNFWRSPVIQQRFLLEANFDAEQGHSHKPHYWFVVPQADTKIDTLVFQNFKASLENSAPHDLQQNFANDIRKGLQKDSSFGGTWVVGYTHPPSTQMALKMEDNVWSRLIAIWLDEDGDPQYTVESELPVMVQLRHGVDYYIGLATNAHQQYEEMYNQKDLKKDMGLKENQQSRQALESLH